MKFKRDYKITITADTKDNCFWWVTHKGAPMSFQKSIEDYKTILSMIDEVRERISNGIKSMDG